MNQKLFDQKFEPFNDIWNTVIVPYFEKFLAFINNCDPYRDVIKQSIDNSWTHYLHLHMALERNIRLQFKNENLTTAQVKFMNDYIAEIHKSLYEDQQIVKQAVKARRDSLLPMPTLEEQIEAHQIFPDHLAYYTVNF